MRVELPGSMTATRSMGSRDAIDVPRDVERLAGELEVASPGLALMMQLRARLFEHAARTARGRGFRQVVTVGCGFPRTRIRRLARSSLRVVELEHPDVVDAVPARRTMRGGALRLSAADFEDRAWSVLVAHGGDPRVERTLFLVEGVSFWGGARAIAWWLRCLSRQVVPGSELLLNVLDDTAAAASRRAIDGGAASANASKPTVSASCEPRARRDPAVGLETVATFDSGDVQRAACGVADMFVRERYLWVRTVASSSRPDRVRCVSPRMCVPRSRVSMRGRPRLRENVEVRQAGEGRAVLLRPVTDARMVGIDVSRSEAAATVLLDGRSSIPRSERLARVLSSAVDVAALADRLSAHGFLGCDTTDVTGSSPIGQVEGASTELDDLREAALRHWSEPCRSWARTITARLACFRENAAARHLRAALGMRRALRVVRKRHVTVLALRRDVSRDGTGERRANVLPCQPEVVLGTALALLTRIRRLLNIGGPQPHVLIDVASVRPAVPLTVVADDVPYTLVRISSALYSPSVLCHELVHAVAMSGSSWLSEGLAVWTQRRLAPGRCYPDDADAACVPPAPRHGLLGPRLRSGVVVGAEDMPARTRGDYREAASFVEWAVRTGGLTGLMRLFRASSPFRTETELDAACGALASTSLHDLERRWESASCEPSSW